MHVLITSGATREPIDSVRFVSNVSTGRLGSALASAFAAAGHRVTLLCGMSAITPDDGSVRVVRFGSTADLLAILEGELLGTKAPDAVVHAAAVADYAPEFSAGKISSAESELVVRMLPTPKVADQIRAMRPDMPLVLFKLESGVDRQELHARARRTMNRAGADAVVANLLEDVGTDGHRADLLVRDGGDAEGLASREEIAAALLALLASRGQA